MLFPNRSGSSQIRSLNPVAMTPAYVPLPGTQLSLLGSFPPPPTPATPSPPTVALVPIEKVAQVVRLSAHGNAITSSRHVAEIFGKEHKHVLRDIREVQATLLDLDDEHTYFAEHSYRDAQNQLRPEIVMTEKGFTLLAMGFTGREAMRYKLAFLDAFEKLQAQVAMPVEVPTPSIPDSQTISNVAQLAYYIRPDFQRTCAKEIAAHVLVEQGGGKGSIIKHHRAVMTLLTGMRPSEYRAQRLQEKKKVLSLSGREMLRRYEPEKAAAAALLDDAVRLGTPLQQLEESNAAKTLPAAFATILALGLRPADLPAGT